MSPLISRILIAVVLLPLVIGVVYLGGWWLFGVALVGGLGSVSGAVICGLALGLIETYATAYGINLGFYTVGQQWQDGYAFVLMIVVLALRPQGLFRGTGDIS